MTPSGGRQSSETFRRLFNRSAKRTSGTPIATTPSPLAEEASLPDPPPYTKTPAPTTDPAKEFLEKALKSLANPEDREVIVKASPFATDIIGAVDASYTAACERKKRCDNESWTLTFGKRTVIVRNEAEKILQLLDRVKSVGNVVAQIDPIHVGLPWAGIRLLLQVRTK